MLFKIVSFSVLMFFAGILYANLMEFFVHKYLFHGLGKKKNSIFAFHIRQHHMVARKNGFVDRKFSLNEFIGIPILMLVHSPILWLSPHMYAAIWIYAILFVVVHNTLHRNPAIAKKYFWWHWNHHMQNQNKSWAVVVPISDVFFRTLQKKP